MGLVALVVKMSHFLSANHDEDQNNKLNKNNSILSFCRMSFWCVSGIFAVAYDKLCQPELVYIVWV